MLAVSSTYYYFNFRLYRSKVKFSKISPNPPKFLICYNWATSLLLIYITFVVSRFITSKTFDLERSKVTTQDFYKNCYPSIPCAKYWGILSDTLLTSLLLEELLKFNCSFLFSIHRYFKRDKLNVQKLNVKKGYIKRQWS